MQRNRALAIVIVALIAATGIAVGWHFGLLRGTGPRELRDLVGRMQQFSYLKPTFVCLYTVAAACGIPATALVIAGGVLFGSIEGFLLNWLSDMLAASLSFGVARFITRVFKPDIGIDTRARPAQGFVGLLRLRVVPVVPFAALNYGSAMYGMKWGPFLLATAIGIIPTTAVYTTFAASLVAGVSGAGRRAIVVTSLCAVGLIALTLLPRLAHRNPVDADAHRP